jgi:monofunctional biosynthetic peptidoglycan transglycosylase
MRFRLGPPVRRAMLTLALIAPAVVTLPATQALCMRVFHPGITLTMVGVTLGNGGGRIDVRWRSIDALGPDVPRAAVGSEDARFFAHHGFDREALCAAWAHNRRGGSVRGGSTISQQTARNLFLWQGRNWVRKGLEAWYTLFLEALVGKERILELYLNVAETGPWVFGFEAAAQHWYDRPASKLGAERAARLVSLLPSPRTRRPDGALGAKKAAWIRANPPPMPGDRRLVALQQSLDERPWWPPCP